MRLLSDVNFVILLFSCSIILTFLTTLSLRSHMLQCSHMSQLTTQICLVSFKNTHKLCETAAWLLAFSLALNCCIASSAACSISSVSARASQKEALSVPDESELSIASVKNLHWNCMGWMGRITGGCGDGNPIMSWFGGRGQN